MQLQKIEIDATPQVDLRQDKKILIPAAIVLFFIVVVSLLNPGATEKCLNSLYVPFVKYTGTYYLWVTFAMIFLSVYFICSRYGAIRFGDPGEKPEFGEGAWIAMMFCSGVAGAVMFWSIVEPLFNLAFPPQYAKALSREAYDWSLAYVLLHWGPVTWPWYAVTALPICFMFYRLKKPVLRISAVAGPVIGEKAVNGWAGSALEVFFIIGLVFSNTAVMGVSLPIVAQALSALVGHPPTFGLQAGILVASTAIFTTSVTLGLKRGIKVLSWINVFIALGMVTFTFVVGPTTQIFNSFTNAFGKMVGNFFDMLFWTSPWQTDSFPQDWTIFYALWMASYGPFMGLFIARISRGRTVRQVLLMSILGGMSGSFLIHGVFGSYTLNVQMSGLVDAVGLLKDSGGPAALIAVLQTLPLSGIVLIGYCLFSTIFLATSVDSSAYILACSATKKLAPGTEPSLFSRFFWAILQGGLALAVISLGGLAPAKIFANFSGALMLVPIAFAVIALFKFIKDIDMDHEARLEKNFKD
ncbi:MAG: BCCT transporter [Candidatus Desulfovibrio kirbyi]|uniref:BCCT transporter n=1 Tax=Candidatus Desulfovibrio kirbyi TaxID=2696086 RepID=A0A6L2R7K3_9BACT|nr:MAG: BCCT transporter [Candidatus Desulfovibrio kirbyi]